MRFPTKATLEARHAEERRIANRLLARLEDERPGATRDTMLADLRSAHIIIARIDSLLPSYEKRIRDIRPDAVFDESFCSSSAYIGISLYMRD